MSLLPIQTVVSKIALALELRLKYISVWENDSSPYTQKLRPIERHTILMPFAFIPFVQMGNSPLHHAAKRGHADLVKFLLANGANINLQNNVGVGLCAQRAHPKPIGF